MMRLDKLQISELPTLSALLIGDYALNDEAERTPQTESEEQMETSSLDCKYKNKSILLTSLIAEGEMNDRSSEFAVDSFRKAELHFGLFAASQRVDIAVCFVLRRSRVFPVLLSSFVQYFALFLGSITRFTLVDSAGNEKRMLPKRRFAFRKYSSLSLSLIPFFRSSQTHIDSVWRSFLRRIYATASQTYELSLVCIQSLSISR